MEYISHDNSESNWIGVDGTLCVTESNRDLLNPGRSTMTSMDNFLRGVGLRLAHTENLMIKKIKLARKTAELETRG